MRLIAEHYSQIGAKLQKYDVIALAVELKRDVTTDSSLKFNRYPDSTKRVAPEL